MAITHQREARVSSEINAVALQEKEVPNEFTMQERVEPKRLC